jgi:flagellin
LADFVTIGGYNYTFVATNAAVAANNDVALGVASGTAGTPTYISAVQATLNNLKAAVASQAIGGGPDAAFTLVTNDYQNAGTGASITSVNGAQAVVTSNLAGVGNGTSTGNSTVLKYTAAAATSNFAGSAAAGSAATTSGGSFQLTVNPLNGNSVTIGNETYTFVSSAPTAAYQVSIGATPNGTLNNLLQAVDNGTVPGANNGIGAGSTYGTGTVANSLAQISGVTGNLANLVSVGTGTLQNAIALSASLSTGAAGGAVPTPTTLTGGSDATNTKASGFLNFASNPLNNSTVTIGSTVYTFVTATPTGANQVAIGAASGNTTAVEATLNNLMEAVNNGPTGTGAGTAYTAGTQANGQASITGVSGNQATVQAVNAGSDGNNISILIGSGNSLGGGGGSVDLSSAADAQAALTVIAGAISTVAASRGVIGSSINQMNAAVQVMNNTSQNLTSSLSGIQDANMGQVIANMSQFQVLEQTGIASLAQANQNQQIVLKLLP